MTIVADAALDGRAEPLRHRLGIRLKHVATRSGLTPGEVRRDLRLEDLTVKLAAKTREVSTLQKRLDAAATAIAALHHDNTLLRQEASRHGQIIPIDTRHH